MRSGQGKRKLSGKYIRGRGACGKKLQAMRIVEKAFDRIEKQTKENPVQVLINAIENSAPREDITRIKRGGISYTVSVDVAPTKRIDEALKNLALAAQLGVATERIRNLESEVKLLTIAARRPWWKRLFNRKL